MEVLAKFYPNLAQEFEYKAQSHQYREKTGTQLEKLTTKFNIPLAGYYGIKHKTDNT